MNIESIVKKFADFHDDKSHTEVADLILEANPTLAIAHRTLRRKISEYRETAKAAVNFVQVVDPNKPVDWQKETTVTATMTTSYVDVLPNPYKKGKAENVLVIGDLHAPFIREGYLEFCRGVQERFNCGTVVFIGDIIDNHYSSYHESDPDGASAGDELDYAINEIQQWYRVFPKAYVCIGNHDAVITRKAFSAGLSNRWIKDYGEVLGTPNWEFELEFEVNGVYYTHGTGSSGSKAAFNRAMNRRQSVVQGHLHTEAGILWNVSKEDRIFSLQVGCGVDDKSYAMAYAKTNVKKYIISCGVVLDGKIPIVVPMEL